LFLFSLRILSLGAVFSSQICNAYAQLSARGVSLIHADASGGVGLSFPDDTCTKFEVSFPSSCPYVTSVGATTVKNGEELADSTNSGGFSNLFERPSYQDAAVSSYLEYLGGAYEGLYNASGRATPDISAFQFIVPTPGAGGAYGSTLWSSALVAAMIAMVNDELIAAGKPTLGFLNPWLYANLDAFYDMTSGHNTGCQTDGFNATTGWDPVSGVGAPRYTKLRAAAGL
jgi:tripeptidyl-peptidase-1